MGRTLGIVGTGKIGTHVAQIAHGLGMKLIGYDPRPNSELTTKYNKESIESATFVFADGVTVEQTHNMASVTPDMLKSIIYKLK